MTSSERAPRAILTTLALAASLGLTSAARGEATAADVETARRLYQQGQALAAKGDHQAALEKLRAAHALIKTPIIALELCKAHRGLRQPVEAREACLSVARIPRSSEETARSDSAREEASQIAEALKGEIATVKVVLRGVPPDRHPKVEIDGVAVPSAAATEPRSVNPGHHAVTAQVDAGPVARAEVDVSAGESHDVVLDVEVPPEAIAPAAPDPSRGAGPGEAPSDGGGGARALRTAGFITLGLGATVGTVAGLVAMGEKAGLECPLGQCGPDQHDDLDRARTWGTVSTVGFVAAGVGLAAAIVGYSIAPSKGARTGVGARPVVGFGGVGLDARF